MALSGWVLFLDDQITTPKWEIFLPFLNKCRVCKLQAFKYQHSFRSKNSKKFGKNTLGAKVFFFQFFQIFWTKKINVFKGLGLRKGHLFRDGGSITLRVQTLPVPFWIRTLLPQVKCCVKDIDPLHSHFGTTPSSLDSLGSFLGSF